MQKIHRVVITGLGALTPIGNTFGAYAKALLDGKSGAERINSFDASTLKTLFACEIKNFYATDFLERKEASSMDTCSIYAVVSSMQAVEDASLGIGCLDPYKVGVIWGTGVGGLKSCSEYISEYAQNTKPSKKINPYFIPRTIASMPSSHIAIKFKIKGPSYATVSACTSASHAIMSAATAIMLGQAEVMITGGSEAPINEFGVNGFSIIKALSERNDSPATASRPFEKNRDGFVLGEGAGALVLESYEHALRRGAKIYAEVAGFAATSDAHHITAPDPEGAGIAKAITLALANAGLPADAVDYINVHGTSTQLGDIAEVRGLQRAFGENLYAISLSATKSMTGHLLGAAGAIESLACIAAIGAGEIPPTINHFVADENFDERINFTFNKKQTRAVSVAMNNTMAFGGHNTSIIFKKFEGGKESLVC